MFARYKNYFLLHLIVFIWGFTGILGALISVSADRLVWYRTMIASACLLIYLWYKKIPLKINLQTSAKFFGTSLIIVIHWLAFYHAIKVSNVSVTLSVFSSASFFMAFLEPLFYKRKLIWYEVLFGVVVMLAIFLIFKMEAKYYEGIFYSFLSAVTSGIFSLINGKLTHQHNAVVISFYELLGGFMILTLFFLLSGRLNSEYLSIGTNDLGWLLLLSVVCTAYTFVKSVDIMKEISPYTVVLTVNLEPVYAIVMASFILNENKQMTSGFYIGTAFIILTVFFNALLKSRSRKTKL